MAKAMRASCERKTKAMRVMSRILVFTGLDEAVGQAVLDGGEDRCLLFDNGALESHVPANFARCLVRAVAFAMPRAVADAAYWRV